MTRVEELSAGQVRLAAGTLYGALENLLKQKLIMPISSVDPRRKVYQITQLGLSVLELDVQRMAHMVGAFSATPNAEDPDEAV